MISGIEEKHTVLIRMRPLQLAVLPLLLASFASAIPLPQELSEAEFRSLRDEATPNHKVNIIDGYANVSCYTCVYCKRSTSPKMERNNKPPQLRI